MKVYVFGNQDLEEDNRVFDVADKLRGVKGIDFIFIKPNQDLPFVGERTVVIMDTILGMKEAKLVEGENVYKIILSPRTSAHDFDLGFQIKYLKKLGKLGEIKIVGIPQLGEINYSSIHSIFKKLVAQDIQGS